MAGSLHNILDGLAGSLPDPTEEGLSALKLFSELFVAWRSGREELHELSVAISRIQNLSDDMSALKGLGRKVALDRRRSRVVSTLARLLMSELGLITPLRLVHRELRRPPYPPG